MTFFDFRIILLFLFFEGVFLSLIFLLPEIHKMVLESEWLLSGGQFSDIFYLRIILGFWIFEFFFTLKFRKLFWNQNGHFFWGGGSVFLLFWI